jgi:hypothetical protein
MRDGDPLAATNAVPGGQRRGIAGWMSCRLLVIAGYFYRNNKPQNLFRLYAFG